MPLQKLQFAPGINRESTDYTNSGGWYDCDLIRFRKGFPETIGGWERQSTTPMQGTCRLIKSWTALDGTELIGAGTHLKLYVVLGGGLVDITPIRSTTSAGDVTFTATAGSSVITVADTGHGARAGDFVSFSGAVTLGGVITSDVLNSEVTVISRTNNTYTVDFGVAANASDSNSGGTVTIGTYQIAVGLDTSVVGNGWGAGGWGESVWGGPADVSLSGAQLRLWSIDNWGEDIVASVRDAGLYYWDRSSGYSQRAVSLASLTGAASAPTVAKSVIVSEKDRHIIAFGCDSESAPGTQDPMLIRFSATESLTEWNTTAENTAGDLRLDSGSEIVSAVQTRQQIFILTNSAAYTMQFIGAPFTFGTTEISVNTTVVSPNAVIAVQDVVYWMGDGLFYKFDGIVSVIACSVDEYVFSDLNYEQAAKIVAGSNAADGEVWWFYPTSGSADINRYVVYNYIQNIWYYGTMARTAWIDRSNSVYPISAASDGYLYYQEFGLDDGEQNPPVGINAYVESSQFEIGSGDDFSFASRIIPDVTFRNSTAPAPEVVFTAKALQFPGGNYYGADVDTVTGTAALPIREYTNQLYVRLRGRGLSIRVESDMSGVAWRLGSPRIELRTDGRR